MMSATLQRRGFIKHLMAVLLAPLGGGILGTRRAAAGAAARPASPVMRRDNCSFVADLRAARAREFSLGSLSRPAAVRCPLCGDWIEAASLDG